MNNRREIKSQVSRYRELSVKEPILFAMVADMLSQLADFKSAMGMVNKGLQQFPMYPTAWVVKGNLHLAKSKNKDALDAFSKALEFDPNIYYAIQKCVELSDLLGEREKYKKHLQHLVKIDPLDNNAQAKWEILRMREVAIENKLFTEEDVQRTMPSVLRQMLLQKNLLPEDIVHRDMRTLLQTKEDIDLSNVKTQEGAAFNNEESKTEWQTSYEPQKQLEEIALEVTGIKPDPTIVAPPVIMSDDTDAPKRMMTKTLAELYVSQGDIQKAIEVYEHLIETNPDNQEFKERIGELKDSTDK